MNRGRNGGEEGLDTQTARSAFAASTCGALPFLFQRIRLVLLSWTATMRPSCGFKGSGATSTMSPGAMGL